jgi:hypothetical protein
MINGHVGRPLLEVLHRIAALGHHRLNQTVSADDSARRIVNELRLSG